MSLLSQVRIATPCSVRWSAMKGDDRIRYCDSCDQQVFNLSELTAPEAEDLLQRLHAASGRSCIRFYRRADGTILTRDCPSSVPLPSHTDARFGTRIMALVALGIGVAATPRILKDLHPMRAEVAAPPDNYYGYKSLAGSFVKFQGR